MIFQIIEFQRDFVINKISKKFNRFSIVNDKFSQLSHTQYNYLAINSKKFNFIVLYLEDIILSVVNIEGPYFYAMINI